MNLSCDFQVLDPEQSTNIQVGNSIIDTQHSDTKDTLAQNKVSSSEYDYSIFQLKHFIFENQGI